MREPNEIDFWRGFALVTIFVNHIPGVFFERFTFRNVSLSDSAELFVFLAGWALRKLCDGPAASLSARWLFFRLEGRAFTVYLAQIVTTEAAIALLAAASILLDAPFLLDWHNASSTFYDPVRAHVGLVTLSYQLGYFNILPLYVVLLLASPLVALAQRHAPVVVLPVSLAIYGFALASGQNFSTWPSEGVWFFDPLSWQLIYVLGFLLAGENGIGAFARRHRRALWWIAIPLVTLGAVAARLDYSPDPIALPEPKLLFMFDKTYLSPPRLLHSLALVALFAGLYRRLARWAPPCCGFLSLLGRNSLNVFCAGSLLSLSGQIIRFVSGGAIVTDAAIVIFGVCSMGAAAWASEWRDRLRVKSSKASAA
ncbi:OpgC family protein [Methylosinus sp. Sm6]|uniref:OpgC family protein n=1 Tax=Methylosinus sp. Sm6 TaxID=2866948 RepID=UPI001C992E99|nr:OpgC domain-containing protein [Methylosinus sp. Sm6]MBY6242720.1 OpgC domain-containing protein [Methylosinus sp. Sm6]